MSKILIFNSLNDIRRYVSDLINTYEYKNYKNIDSHDELIEDATTVLRNNFTIYYGEEVDLELLKKYLNEDFDRDLDYYLS